MELKEIRSKVENPGAKSDLDFARKHEARLKFHAQTALDNSQVKDYETKFLDWVRTILTAEDKFLLFTNLFRYPLATVNLTEEAFTALEKVFDGRDPSYTVQFEKPDLEDDWHAYRSEALHEPAIWKEDAFALMKTAINSVIIVDLPREQKGNTPEPYFYFLDTSDIIDFKVDKRGVMEYIIFKQPEQRIAAMDATTTTIVTCDEGYKEVKAVDWESEHGLGYCPARFLWTSSISTEKKALKRAPITTHLNDLDWYLFFSISKRNLDLYAPYPIYSGFETDCEYKLTGEDGRTERCSRGYLRDDQNNYIVRNAHPVPCPVCSKSNITGPGTFIRIPAPSKWNNNADFRDPVKVTGADVQSLEYNTKEIGRIEREFFERVTGYGGEAINDQAVNEKQVKAFFEGRTNTLRSLKKEFEGAQKWTDETVCRLRYGNAFKGLSLDYGNEFYILSADELFELYTSAKEKGADTVTLDTVQDQYYETRFRNNPKELERVILYLEIEPFRHITPERVTEMYEKRVIKFEEYFLKVNFSSLIMRFERENGPITEFKSKDNLKSRVEAINQILLTYIEKPDSEPAVAGGKAPAEGEPMA